jgi:preprotein translocase subunit SecE
VKLIKTVLRFIKDVYYELKKVVWLDSKKIIGITFAVIMFVIVMSVFVSLIDLFLGKSISVIL